MSEESVHFEEGGNLPVPSEDGSETRLTRIEQNLDKLVAYEAHSRALVNNELVGRLKKLEDDLATSRRVNRAMAVLFVVLLIAFAAGAGVYMHNQFQLLHTSYLTHFVEMQRMLLAQSAKYSDISKQLAVLNAMGFRAGSTQTDIKGLTDLVNKVLSSENNGFLMNLRVQNELLDELAGKKKRRPARMK